jgi:hypothetical protein
MSQAPLPLRRKAIKHDEMRMGQRRPSDSGGKRLDKGKILAISLLTEPIREDLGEVVQKYQSARERRYR